MKITGQILAAIALDGNPQIMAAIAAELDAQMAVAHLDTPLRAAHFLAQCCEESQGFTRLSENLNYSAERIGEVWPHLAPRAATLAHNPQALAEAVYGGRNGNGPEGSGDGFRFRGRGLLQHTFRSNYAELEEALNLPLVDNPGLLTVPANAVRAAIWFFQSRGCVALADDDDIGAITRKINGGTLGLSDRAIFKARALKLLGT